MTEEKTQAELRYTIGDRIGKARAILSLCELAHMGPEAVVSAWVQDAMIIANEQLSEALMAFDDIEFPDDPAASPKT